MIEPMISTGCHRSLAFPSLVIAAALLAAPAGAQQAKPAAPGRSAPAPSGALKPAGAQPAKPAAAGGEAVQPVLLASFGDWGAYASQQGKSKVCYALSQPRERAPKNLNRDPAYLFVASRPAEGVRNEVSLVMGFATKDGADAQAVVGPAAFALVTKLSNAWVKNPAEEGQVLAALARGDKLVVKAESKRGNKLSDEYSLKGFGQALDRVKKECP